LEILDGTIREARQEDLDAICGMFCDLYARLGELGFLFSADEEKLKKNMANRLDAKFFKIYVYEKENLPAGFINLSIIKENSNFLGARFSGLINELYVKKEFRRKKIGSALLQKAFDFFAAESVNRVNLNVVFANADAAAFYKNAGFKEDYISFIKILEN
jgi:GNAT superfamily N-acetyltransferase